MPAKPSDDLLRLALQLLPVPEHKLRAVKIVAGVHLTVILVTPSDIPVF
jgi:hypothetical protein